MTKHEQSYWTRRQASRRRVLKGSFAGAGGLLGAALVGCGSEDDDGPPAAAPTAAAGASPVVVQRNKGGKLRFGFTIPTRVSPRGATGGTHQEYLNVLGDSYVYINSKGELVGINTAILAPAGGNVGIGFAVPTSMVHTVVDQLLKHGTVKRGRIGIAVQTATADIATALGAPVERGAVIGSVDKGSAGSRAALTRCTCA